MTSQKKRDWTVFFLVKSTDSTITEAIKMVDHLMGIPFPDNVAILLCIYLNAKNRLALETQDISLAVLNDPQPQPTTLFCQISTIVQPDGSSSNIFTVFKEESTFDITNENDLGRHFRDNILLTFQAGNYLLFTWDHGNGFGIFSQPVGSSTVATTMALGAKILTMEELSNAIMWSMGIEKIDLVVMMNCHMQVFDTGYALRNNAKYLVAPQSNIPLGGYNYRAIFDKLSRTPRMTGKALADWVRGKLYRSGSPAANVSLSACRLKHYDLMASLLDKLADLLALRLNSRPAYDELIYAITEARSVHGAFGLIDLYSFLSKLDASATSDEKVWIKYLFLLKTDVVYSQYLGASLNPPSYDVWHTHNGISILSPNLDHALEATSEKLVRYFSESTFSQHTKWGRLMACIRDRKGIVTSAVVSV